MPQLAPYSDYTRQEVHNIFAPDSAFRTDRVTLCSLSRLGSSRAQRGSLLRAVFSLGNPNQNRRYLTVKFDNLSITMKI